MSPETKEAMKLLEKHGLYEKHSPFEEAFPKNTTPFEKFIFLIMHLTAGLWIIPVIALCAGKSYGEQLLYGDIIAFVSAYLLFKFLHTRRTGESVSMGFNPKFHWAGEQYDRKRVTQMTKDAINGLRKNKIMKPKTFSRIGIILTALATFLVVCALEDTKIHGYRAVQILDVGIECVAIWAFVKIGNRSGSNKK